MLSGDGAFTSYAAQIVRRQVAQGCVDPTGNRRVFLEELEASEDDAASWQPKVEFKETAPSTDPEKVTIYRQVEAILQRCIENLAERRCIAFWYCEVEERSRKQWARFLQSTTTARSISWCFMQTRLHETVFESTS